MIIGTCESNEMCTFSLAELRNDFMLVICGFSSHASNNCIRSYVHLYDRDRGST